MLHYLINDVMYNFIEDYLKDPSAAVSNARNHINSFNDSSSFSDDHVYSEISTPEFRLYSEIVS